MVSVKVVLKKFKKEDKFGFIKLRITENRIPTYKSLKIRVDEKHWLETKQRVSKNHPESENINKIIEQSLEDPNLLKGSLIKGGYKTDVTHSNSFIEYFTEFITSYYSSYGSIRKKTTVLNGLKKYLKSINRKDLNFEEITPIFLNNFKNFLLKNNLGKNTSNKYLKDLRVVINSCIKSGVYIYKIHPFLTIKLKDEDVEKKRLELEDIHRIINLPSNLLDEKVINVRNYFLFQIFTQGMRVSDLQLLKWDKISDDGRINYTMFKTGNVMSVLISFNVLKILYHYLPDDIKKTPIITIKSEEFDFNFIMNIDFVLKKPNSFGKIKSKVKSFETNINKDRYEPKYYHLKRGGFYKYSTEGLIKEIQDVKTFYNYKEIDTPHKPSEKEYNEKLELVIHNLQDKIYQGVHNLIKNLKNNKELSNQFVFPFFKSDEFSQIVEEKGIPKLNKDIYNKLMSNTTTYNRYLKKLQKICGIEVPLTTHITRHTFTELLLNENVDLYSISKSLGHKNLSVTQKYINNFNKKVVDENVSKINSKLNLDLMD